MDRAHIMSTTGEGAGRVQDPVSEGGGLQEVHIWKGGCGV